MQNRSVWRGGVLGLGLAVGLGASVLLVYGQDAGEDPDESFSVAGLPFADALVIYEQHKDALKQLPGAEGVILSPEGILVSTDKPAELPLSVGGIPVLARPLRFPPIAGIPRSDAKAIFAQHRDWLKQIPGVESVQLGLRAVLVYTATPEVLPLSVGGLPIESRPSLGLPIKGIPYVDAQDIFARSQKDLERLPGVELVRLSLDGIQVHTTEPEAVPSEVEGLPVFAASPISTPIAGLPFKEAQAIFARHKADLAQYPGVEDVALGSDGIWVYTTNPEALPEEIEEVPIRTFPVME